jgi:hypothetical protein
VNGGSHKIYTAPHPRRRHSSGKWEMVVRKHESEVEINLDGQQLVGLITGYAQLNINIMTDEFHLSGIVRKSRYRGVGPDNQIPVPQSANGKGPHTVLSIQA